MISAEAYRKQLKKKIELLKAELKTKEEALYKNRMSIDSRWLRSYEEFNRLKIRLQTAESRLENMTNAGGIEPVYVGNKLP